MTIRKSDILKLLSDIGNTIKTAMEGTAEALLADCKKKKGKADRETMKVFLEDLGEMSINLGYATEGSARNTNESILGLLEERHLFDEPEPKGVKVPVEFKGDDST